MITDGWAGQACGQPADRYPQPVGLAQLACPKHRAWLLELAAMGPPRETATRRHLRDMVQEAEAQGLYDREERSS